MQASKQNNSANLAAVLIVILGVSASAQLEISRSTVDGGGGMHSAGGNFDLSGTIGQPDAGTMSGGSFELTGGFWFEIPLTDCNEDGAANLLDHSSFTDCLAGPAVSVLTECECFDTDDSGAVDLRDFLAAQVEFSGL